MEKIAIYDLDRTLTRIGTYTPFLFFAARRSVWRLALLPAYFLAMPLYKLGLISRRALKQWGFRLAVGSRVAPDRMEALSRRYAERVCARNLHAFVVAQCEEDKAEGRMLVMASAAPEIYARIIGQRLGFDHVIATRQARHASGTYSHRIEGQNCYGEAKLRAIQDWLPVEREVVHVRFYSDHHTDGPVFAWCDEPVAVNPSAKTRALAETGGWRIMTAP